MREWSQQKVHKGGSFPFSFLPLKNFCPAQRPRLTNSFSRNQGVAIMYDPSSAFTHDDFFQSSIENDHVSTVAVPASENATQHQRPNIPVTTICGKSSAEAGVPDLNPHREILVDTISRGESGTDSVAHEEVPVHRIEPKDRDQQKIAESDTVTSQGDMIEIEDLGLGTNQDSVCAPTLHECPVKAAASCEEAAPGTVLMVCEAAQDAQSDVKKTGNESVQAAFEGENLASDICPSAPRRNVCRPMRPSRGIHPIDKSPSFVSAKRRHAVSLRPSRGVQPIMSQTFALAVVVEAASDPQTVLTRATDSTVSDSSSSESDPVPQPESRKREAAKQIVETAKRARQSDECMFGPDQAQEPANRGYPALVSQNGRPRRSTRSSAGDAHYFKYNYESVQQECDSLRRGIDDLDVQLRREVKGLQRRFRKKAQEAGDCIREQHRSMVEKVQAEVRALEGKFQSDTEALQVQLDVFMVDLKNEGLVNLDA